MRAAIERPTVPDRQPALPDGLVSDAKRVVADLANDMSRQDAAVLVHAGAMAQHAVTLRMVDDGASWRETLAAVARLHPGLTPLAQQRKRRGLHLLDTDAYGHHPPLDPPFTATSA